MSDKYDTAILAVLGVVFVCIVLFGNRDIWRRGRTPRAVLQAKTGPSTDWSIALAALMVVLFCCAVALQR
jgi:hypothetical protein